MLASDVNIDIYRLNRTDNSTSFTLIGPDSILELTKSLTIKSTCIQPPQTIVLKNLKNRWGSVTKIDTINLNRNLIKAPEDIIDYIIIHELCHLKIHGHYHNFWSFLKQFVPDYQKK